ncbi:ABC transporter permease [Nocardioides flavescens]|uniref:Autoinducer 2 import system permease protein LsrC n=1 Tax=Nocardioides flavescens TaxID=2691959 RepID=A0A6L7EZA0_9ACTN|nr:ABC transporter permease [Nocardioides flavescens]MXG89251.1 ABC transporter permease [Nocardioides flavescens]
MSTVLDEDMGAGAGQGAGASRRTALSLHRTELVLALVAVAGFGVLAATTGGNILQPGTMQAVLQFLAVPIVVGLAQMVVLSVGQMNLSVGALTGLCAMAAASLMADSGLTPWLALPAALLVGALAGLVNGTLVVLTRINGFIVTLATMSVISGLRFSINGTGTYQDYSPGLVRLGRADVLGLPVVFLVAVATAVLVWFFFARCVAGRMLLASGGNPFAARLSGISNDRSVVLAHLLSGLLAAVAGVLVVALSGSVNASVGDDLLLPSFAAPIIGGVVLTGGVVSVLGTCLAAFIVRLVDVAQAQYGINPRWVDLVVGAVVLGAVLVSQRRGKGSS